MLPMLDTEQPIVFPMIYNMFNLTLLWLSFM